MSQREQLPMGWTWATVGELAERVVVGFVGPSTGHRQSADVPLIMGKNIRSGQLDLTDVEYVTSGFHQREKKSQLQPNDVVVVRIGRSGEAAVVPPALGEANCAGLVIVKQPRGVLPEFLARYLNSPAGMAASQAEVRGVTRATLNTRKVEGATVPVPPLAEQRRIVAKLDELFASSRGAGAALDAVPALLERYRQAVLVAAMRGDLTADWRQSQCPPAVTLGGGRERVSRRASRSHVAELAAAARAEGIVVPDGWTLTDLGAVARLQPGYAFKSADFRPDGVRLLRGINIEPGATRWEQVVCLDPAAAARYDDFALVQGDVVIAMDRPFISTGLKVARIGDTDLPSLLLQRVGRFQPSPFLDAGYLWLYLQSATFQKHIGGQATGTQLPHISSTDIETAPMPVPTVGEQREIVRRASNMLDRLEVVHDHVRACQARLAMLNERALGNAFRGVLLPQDPNDEPAAVLLERLRSAHATAPVSRRARRVAAPA